LSKHNTGIVKTYINEKTIGYFFCRNESGEDDVAYKPTGFQFDSIDTDGLMTVSKKGYIGRYIYQEGTDSDPTAAEHIGEWITAIMPAEVSTEHATAPVFKETDKAWGTRTDSDEFTAVYADGHVFPMFKDFNGELAIFQSDTNIAQKFNDYPTSLASGSSSFNAPIWFTDEFPDDVEYTKGDGFDTNGDQSTAFMLRMVKALPGTFNGLPTNRPAWVPCLVLTCEDIDEIINVSAILSQLALDMVNLKTAVNQHAQLLDGSVQAGGGLGAGTATQVTDTYTYTVCGSAAARTDAASDVHYRTGI